MSSPVASRSYQFPILSAPSSPASVPTNNHLVCKQPQQQHVEPFSLPPPATFDDDHSLETAFNELKVRIDRLRTFLLKQQQKNDATALLLRACQETLRSRIPLVMHQTYQTMKQAGVNDVRSTFAVYRAIQYVDRLQEAMDPTTNQGIEEQLATVLSEIEHPFRLSPWVASDLCFDAPVGESATFVISDSLNVEVESIVEFRAHDTQSVNYARAAAVTPVKVAIQSCKHTKKTFGLGAGTIGQATITVRLDPLHAEKKVLQVWGIDQPVPALQIKEARVVQLNAYPPKPRASIDMNTSYTYGDAGVTITMVVTTCVTNSPNEPPNLLVELFMAPPKPM